MNCDYVINNLHEFIYNELDTKKSETLKKHICTCSKCYAEYTKLKKLLVCNIDEINIIKNSIPIPENLSKKIHKKLNKKTKITKNYIIAASLLFIFISIVPSVSAYLSKNKSLNKYIVINNNIVKKLNNGKGTILNESCTMNDIKFTIDAIIEDKNTINILYSVKLLNPKNYNFALPSKFYIQDEFGFKGYLVSNTGTLETTPKDNETKCICSFKKPSIISNKIKIRITCFNKGLYKRNEGNENPYKYINNTYGNWYVEFKLP
ncbi:hypothetical protein Z957_08905 [Clostridium sp. K25]|uniref:DUF4179 domain-containing protein n=1 Tax=Clostridium TaxID=1485 RepID=UPI0004D757E1|nr:MULTISPECIES: DUF4179 domain-containing protein [Clostridium]AYF53898.1 DUF4179 domain-containing protein [Clostridium novyi]KEI07218.1 hypothetical protein Z957_08905 [Clostridium sp. K25]